MLLDRRLILFCRLCARVFSSIVAVQTDVLFNGLSSGFAQKSCVRMFPVSVVNPECAQAPVYSVIGAE